MKLVPKRSAPKWTSNKIGNAKNNKMGRAKVVAPQNNFTLIKILSKVNTIQYF